ncbi:MAG: hypothetical protein KAQ68_08105 [Clostridiales bacterium]|nr:hypothetical protein [Clostridiales bacterium]
MIRKHLCKCCKLLIITKQKKGIIQWFALTMFSSQTSVGWRRFSNDSSTSDQGLRYRCFYETSVALQVFMRKLSRTQTK